MLEGTIVDSCSILSTAEYCLFISAWVNVLICGMLFYGSLMDMGCQ